MKGVPNQSVRFGHSLTHKSDQPGHLVHIRVIHFGMVLHVGHSNGCQPMTKGDTLMLDTLYGANGFMIH